MRGVIVMELTILKSFRRNKQIDKEIVDGNTYIEYQVPGVLETYRGVLLHIWIHYKRASIRQVL
jgi:hypothetical protein